MWYTLRWTWWSRYIRFYRINIDATAVQKCGQGLTFVFYKVLFFYHFWGEITNVGPNFDFGRKFGFLKISGYWSISLFLGNVFIYFWPNFWFLTKYSIFDQNFRFWPRFCFLTKISIFDWSFHFWPNLFRYLTKHLIFITTNLMENITII